MTHDQLRHTRQENAPPAWRRPRGLAAGTWQYVNQRSIARHYDDFVGGTPLCDLDWEYLKEVIPQPGDPGIGASTCELEKVQDSGDSLSPFKRQTLVLDLGAGTGRLAFPLSRLGYDVLAIDLSQSMLEQVVSKSAEEKTGNVALKSTEQSAVAKADKTGRKILPGMVYPLRANLVELGGIREGIACHAICMFSTLGMIQGSANRVEFLQHCRRAVQPGGTLVIHVHRRWAAIREPKGWKGLIRSWVSSLQNQDAEFGDSTYAYRGLEKMFMHRFTVRELRKELTCAGWKVVRTDRVNLVGDQLSRSRWNSSGYFVVCERDIRS